MKLFSGPEKTVTDERVVIEYYKAGHFSYVIVFCLILLGACRTQTTTFLNF